MSNRLDKEREAELQPVRMQYAKARLDTLGYAILKEDKTSLQFYYKGEIVTVFPYSGWHTGRSILDGRGIEKLLKQIA